MAFRNNRVVKASAAAFALFVIGGCSAHRQRPELMHLSDEDARNATYRTGWGKSGAVTLSEGFFSFPLRAKLEAVAAGDLNQYGGTDLAAVVVFRPGGTGAFYELHALVGGDGHPQDVGSALLWIASVFIAVDVVVQFAIQAPEELPLLYELGFIVGILAATFVGLVWIFGARSVSFFPPDGDRRLAEAAKRLGVSTEEAAMRAIDAGLPQLGPKRD